MKANLLRRSRMPSQLLGGDLWWTGCIIHLLGTMLSALLCVLCIEVEIHTITAGGGVTSGQIQLLAWWLENEHYFYCQRHRSQVGQPPNLSTHKNTMTVQKLEISTYKPVYCMQRYILAVYIRLFRKALQIWKTCFQLVH